MMENSDSLLLAPLPTPKGCPCSVGLFHPWALPGRISPPLRSRHLPLSSCITTRVPCLQRWHLYQLVSCDTRRLVKLSRHLAATVFSLVHLCSLYFSFWEVSSKWSFAGSFSLTHLEGEFSRTIFAWDIYAKETQELCPRLAQIFWGSSFCV